MNYQSLFKYKGSLYGEPAWEGIEYDFEVPDNTVVSSPGGVSAIQHHYTKGMYSQASSRSDVYGGEGFRYPYGEFGNLYQTGQNGPTQIGDFFQPPDQMYTQNQGTPRRDNFRAVPGVETIPPPDTVEAFSADGRPVSPKDLPDGVKPPKSKLSLVSPWVLALVILVFYVAISFWTKGGEELVVQRFNHGKPLTWKWYLVYASIFTAITVALAYLIDVPFVVIEQV